MFGKFDSRIAEYLYSLSLDGCHDEETGHVEELGWYARFDGCMSPTHAQCHEFDLTSDDVAELANMAGAILSTDNDGFVGATSYAQADALETAWTEIEDDYSLFDPEVLHND